MLMAVSKALDKNEEDYRVPSWALFFGAIASRIIRHSL
jgi:hypothetical protein